MTATEPDNDNDSMLERLLDRATGHVDIDAEPVEPTPIYIDQRTRLILLSAFVIVIILLANAAPSVPRLLLVGSTLALILSFPVRLLSRWMPRGRAILIVMASTVLFSVIGLILVIPFITSEISGFVEQLPEILQGAEKLLRKVLDEFYLRGWLEQNPDAVIQDIETGIFDRGQVFAERALGQVLDSLSRTFSLLISVFGVIFVTTYLLIDIPRFREKFVISFSPAYRPDADWLWSTLGESLSRYLAGLLISIMIQGTLVTIGLTLLDIPYAFVLGIWMALTAVLPYIGAFLGAIPSVLIALTISWQATIAVTLLYIIVNQIEGNFITPKIQGDAVRVHPLLIFFSVIGGSQIAGPLGAILAVPTLAVIRVLFEFFWDRLRIRGESQETVLVALGGDDDETVEVKTTTAGDGTGTSTHTSVDTGPNGTGKPVDVDVDIGVDSGPDAARDTSAPATAAGTAAAPGRPTRTITVGTFRRRPATRHRTRPALRRAGRTG